MPRPSLLNLDVRVSVHPASDVLSFRFCSCGGIGGSFRARLEGYFASSYYGFHLYGGDVLFHH